MNIMRDNILNVINSNSGIKEVQLAMRVMQYIEPSQFSDAIFHHELAKLLLNGEIIAVHYVLPTMNDRQKSVYFPKGTKMSFDGLDWTK